LGLIAGYYLATPAFAAADLVFGLPVRVAGLAEPAHRLAYYAVVFALGLLCRYRPGSAPFVGMTESSVNLLLLLVAILLPIWSLPEALASGAPVSAGTMLAFAIAVVQRAFGRPGRPWMAWARAGSWIPLAYGGWAAAWPGLRAVARGGGAGAVATAVVVTGLAIWLLRAWSRLLELRRLADVMTEDLSVRDAQGER
jgi:hypothetical protein